jgi:hypothetical protein
MVFGSVRMVSVRELPTGAGLLLCLCALVPRTKVATQATVKIDSAFALAGKTTLFSLVMIGTFTARRKAGASERALLFFDERRL